MKDGKIVLIGVVVAVVLGIIIAFVRLIICMAGVVEHAHMVSGRCYNDCEFESEEKEKAKE